MAATLAAAAGSAGWRLQRAKREICRWAAPTARRSGSTVPFIVDTTSYWPDSPAASWGSDGIFQRRLAAGRVDVRGSGGPGPDRGDQRLDRGGEGNGGAERRGDQTGHGSGSE